MPIPIPILIVSGGNDTDIDTIDCWDGAYRYIDTFKKDKPINRYDTDTDADTQNPLKRLIDNR